MDVSFFDIPLVISLLVVIVIIVRLYNALKMVNARVTLLSGLTREMRQALVLAGTIPWETPSVGAGPVGEEHPVAGPAKATPAPRAAAPNLGWSEAEEADRHLEGSLGRDFSMPNPPVPRRSTGPKPEGPRGPIKLGARPK
jgi:hypothetical protein